MGIRLDEQASRDRELGGIPELRPWREVGWIFRDGTAVAVERSGGRTRARAVRLSYLREDD